MTSGNEEDGGENDIELEYENSSVALKLKKLRDKLNECQKQKDEYLAGWQRTKADFINARKDNEKKRKEFEKMADASLFGDLLLIADGFEMAFKDDAWQKLDKTWQDGIKYLYNQFINVFKEHNLEPIKALGKKFNPEEHNAVGEVEVVDEKKDGIVVEELRKGYKLYDKVLRPAQVKVGRLQITN